MVNRVFNESVFSSYANLQSFFNSSDAIQNVLSQKDMLRPTVCAPYDVQLSWKWKICQIATFPFRWILAIFLRCTATTLSCFGISQWAKRLKSHAKHINIGFEFCSEESTRLFKIKSSLNRSNEKGEIVNSHPSIPANKLTDPRVKKRTFCSVVNEVRFGHSGGICRGMSYWFLYLYLKTKDQFCDPRSHMAALGKQFSRGGGMDPTLLQSLKLQKGKLLNLKIGSQPIHSTNPRPVRTIKVSPAQFRSNASEMIHQLQNVPTGAYVLGLPIHETAFVKINERLGYFFEPNRGIIEIQGNELGEKLYSLIDRSLNATGDGAEEEREYDVTPLYIALTSVSLRI